MFPNNIHLYGMKLSDNNVLCFLLHLVSGVLSTVVKSILCFLLQLARFGVTAALIFESVRILFHIERTVHLDYHYNHPAFAAFQKEIQVGLDIVLAHEILDVWY